MLYDIGIQIVNTSGDIEIIYRYNSELLDSSKMEKLFRNYIKVIYTIEKIY